MATATTAEIVEERTVHSHIYDPSRSIFKSSARDRAIAFTIHCKLASCPLRDRGMCARARAVMPDQCPYGRNSQETGPTKRASSLFRWVSDRKKNRNGVPYLKSPPNKLAFIGDYVYLPYSHMAMCETVEFLSHSKFLVYGNPFLPRTCWTIETVLRLIKFRPMSLLGGEILTYQGEEVPLFLQHLRECDPEMWVKVISKLPELDTTPNYVGRKALLKTLNAPIIIAAKNIRYPVEWEWNGDAVVTNSHDAYSDTWGGIKLKSLSLIGVPDDDSAVVVKDNSWVNESTVFVD